MRSRCLAVFALAVATFACRAPAEPVDEATDPTSTAAPAAAAPTTAPGAPAGEGSAAAVAPAEASAQPTAEGSATWTVVAAEAVPAEVIAKADAARTALAGRLLSTLTTTIAERGHAAAVTTCHDQAPAISQAVANELGVAIGRTSFRTRNAANTPPAWASAWVDERIETARWTSSSDGRFGQLAPIRLAQPCLACHGPTAQIAPDVASAIAANYPSDAATGFAEGDLRGYIWVEVPAP